MGDAERPTCRWESWINMMLWYLLGCWSGVLLDKISFKVLFCQCCVCFKQSNKCYLVVQGWQPLPAIYAKISCKMKKPSLVKTVKVHMPIANNQLRLMGCGSDRRVMITDYLLWFKILSFRDSSLIIRYRLGHQATSKFCWRIFPNDTCCFK